VKNPLDHPIDALVAAARKTLEVEIRRLRQASLEAKTKSETGMLNPEYQRNLIAACKVAGDLKKVDIAEQSAKKKRLAQLLPQLSEHQLEQMESLLRKGVDPEEAVSTVLGN
jgi:hypothetical protein